MADTYPFRFYGRRPGDWIEGANGGHLYEIRFAEALSAEDKVAIAEAFEKKLARGPAEAAAAPWLWADRSAQIRLGERRGRARPDAFFDAVEAMLRALHGRAPLEQVIFRGCREPFGAHPWDAWSIARRAEPESPFRGPTQVAGEVDAAFEEAREIARDGAEKVAARKAREAELRSSGLLATMAIAKSALPPRRKLDAATLAALAGLQIMRGRISLTGRIIAKVLDPKIGLRLVFFDDAGALHTSDLRPSRFDPGIHLDGVAAYLPGAGPEGEGVYEIALPSGAHRLLLPIDIGLTPIAVGGVAGGLLAVGHGDELKIYDVSGAAPELLATHPLVGQATDILAAREGRVAVVSASAQTTVIGIRGRESAVLNDRPLISLSKCYEAEGRIVGQDWEEKSYELVNVDVAFARAFPET
ncbi:Hypothetical protein A7982_08885 [Minicystis rosea]|nr:Hypothetical protein A7982_08885 [Minicystis rosea]